MPTTVEALLVIVFCILPGMLGEGVYRRLIGADWREQQWHRILHTIGFSVWGLVLYLIVCSWFDVPLPSYVFPTTFRAMPLGRDQLTTMALALGGHSLGSALAGLVGAGIVHAINRWTLATGYPDSWHRFVRSYVARHWVVIRLENGEAYAGMIERADTTVCQNERDVVLAEPAQFLEEKENYISLPYQYLFLPGALIASIAVVHDRDLDARVSEVGSLLFPELDGESEEDSI